MSAFTEALTRSAMRWKAPALVAAGGGESGQILTIHAGEGGDAAFEVVMAQAYDEAVDEANRLRSATEMMDRALDRQRAELAEAQERYRRLVEHLFAAHEALDMLGRRRAPALVRLYSWISRRLPGPRRARPGNAQ